MPDLLDGGTAEIRGSAAKPYILKNIGGVYSCSCPAWRNQSLPIDRRSCKHLRQYRGEAAEQDRLGTSATVSVTKRSQPEAPALLLAYTWENRINPKGWWLSEKLDGVRAYWDGKGQFLSRQGNRYLAPLWFTRDLPAMPLDGELWMGRKQFQSAVSIVRRQDEPDSWSDLKFVVFDAPHCGGVFENRVAFVERTFKRNRPRFAEVLHHYRCHGASHLIDELARIEALGGEGLMLREPGSRYEAGRSSTLLKLKRFHDAEAQVIGHQAGRGRHKGRLGALLAILPDGTEFAVGSGLSDAERDNPPAVGSTITFRYQEMTDGGVPRFPTFVRLRSDKEFQLI